MSESEQKPNKKGKKVIEEIMTDIESEASVFLTEDQDASDSFLPEASAEEVEEALEAGAELETVDVELEGGDVGRDEEGEALDVVPVRVGEEEVDRARVEVGGADELEAELADAGARVDDHRVGGALEADLQAGGVAAEFRVLRARHRDAAARAPEHYLHGASPVMTCIFAG